MAYAMAIASGKVRAEIVDWSVFKDWGRSLKVTTVPRTFINHRDPFSGVITEEEFLDRVLGSP